MARANEPGEVLEILSIIAMVLLMAALPCIAIYHLMTCQCGTEKVETP